MITKLFTRRWAAAAVAAGALLPFAGEARAQFVENFDALTAPELPAGWTASVALGSGAPWATVSDQSSTPPNAAFANSTTGAADHRLTLPAIISSGEVTISFQRRLNLELVDDGLILEYSVNGGPFLNVGDQAWVLNGYNTTIRSSALGNPLTGQRAFSGELTDWTLSSAQVLAPAGQSVVFRFRLGMDGLTLGNTGVWIDDIVTSSGPSMLGSCCDLSTRTCTIQPPANCTSPFVFTASQTCAAAPCPGPDNDDCSTAININAAGGGIWPFTSGAISVQYASDDARDVECDAHAGFLRGGLWWTYTTGPSAERLTLSETGAMEVVFSIWTGTCAEFAPLICSDGASDVFNVNLAPSTTYQICLSKVSLGYIAGNTVTLTIPTAPVILTPPAHDTCAGAVNYDALGLSNGVINTLASVEYASATTDAYNTLCDTNMGLLQGVWYRHATGALPELLTLGETTTEDSRFTVLKGTCGSLSILGCSEGTGTTSTESASFVLAPNGVYSFVYSKGGNAGLLSGSVMVPTNITPTVRIDVLPAAPANDDCAGAVAISSMPYTSPAVILSAGANNDPAANPSCDNVQNVYGANRGVWFTYTTGAAPVTLAASETTSQDSCISFWAGSGPCAGLTQLECNGTTVDTSGYIIQIPAHTTVYIVVSRDPATSPAAGDGYALTLNEIAPPANDNCATAINIPVSSSSPFTSTALDARGARADANVSCNVAGMTEVRAGVWYRYAVPSGVDNYTLTLTESSNIDALMSVYQGSDCGALTPVLCTLQDTFNTFSALPGNTYYILLGMQTTTKVQPQGNFSLSIAHGPVTGACCNGSTCNIGIPASACAGGNKVWLGANSSCVSQPAYTTSSSLTIPDNSLAGISESMNVSGFTGIVSNLRISMDLTHTWAGNLIIRLQGPNGVTVNLISRPGATTGCNPPAIALAGSPNKFEGRYVFDDAASQNINSAVLANATLPPGDYRPSACGAVDVSLAAAFNGIDPNGVWTLSAFDLESGRVGTVSSWGLTINDTPNPCNVAGACCTDAGCVMAATSAACGSIFGNFQGWGSTCQPSNACPQTTVTCCRGTTCNTVPGGSCTGSVAGSASVIVGSCGAGGALASCCYADFNHDGAPTIDDLFLYLNAYFTGSPWANVGGDGVETPTIDDLFLYINAYFTGCQ